MAEAKTGSVPSDLVERMVRLATEMSRDAALADALDRVSQPMSGQYAAWQTAGVAGFLDGLEQRNTPLALFGSSAGADLRRVMPRLEPVFVQARRIARDASAGEADRLLAIRLLGPGTTDQQRDLSQLAELLSAQNPAPIQQAALAGLRRGSGPQVAELLLKSWRGAGLIERQEILNTIFSRPAWVEALLNAIEEGRLSPMELGTLQQQKLLNHSVPEIRERANRMFSKMNSDRQKVVEKYKVVAALNGNRERGKTLFTQNCSICHRLRGEGRNIGPDLGTVADKPVQELVVAILDPNQAVDPAYTAYTVTTRDGGEFSGILAGETPNSISLRMPGGAEEVILRSNVKEITSSGRSLMPEGFETGLKPQDLADLIAFILSSGNLSVR